MFDPDKEREARENQSVQRGLEQARRGELTDGPKLERREAEQDRRQKLRRTDDSIREIIKEAPMAELQALAATVRQCQRNGHPDLSKHLETLLTKLGA